MATGLMYRVVQVASGVAGTPYYLTGYFEAAGGSAQQAADAWRAFVSPGASSLRAGLIYDAIDQVETVDPVTGNTVLSTAVTVAALPFTSATDPIPPSNQIVVRWHTGIFIGGREVRGRTNIAGFTETDSILGAPSAAVTSAWSAKAIVLTNALNANHVIWSRQNGLWHATTSGSAWAQWAVLRSRRD